MFNNDTAMNFETLIQLNDHFANEHICREHLATLRWGKDGIPCCPFCGVEGAYSIEAGKRYKCKDKACHRKFSVTVGTISTKQDNIRGPELDNAA